MKDLNTLGKKKQTWKYINQQTENVYNSDISIMMMTTSSLSADDMYSHPNHSC